MHNFQCFETDGRQTTLFCQFSFRYAVSKIIPLIFPGPADQGPPALMATSAWFLTLSLLACLTLDYLMSHDILIEFWLFVHSHVCSMWPLRINISGSLNFFFQLLRQSSKGMRTCSANSLARDGWRPFLMCYFTRKSHDHFAKTGQGISSSALHCKPGCVKSWQCGNSRPLSD